jgi:hypothetical protein
MQVRVTDTAVKDFDLDVVRAGLATLERERGQRVITGEGGIAVGMALGEDSLGGETF